MKQPPPIPLSEGHGGRSRWRADRCLIKFERLAPKCAYPGQGRCRPRAAMCQQALSRTRRQFRVGRQSC